MNNDLKKKCFMQPLQIYVICHYFHDVQSGTYVDETGIRRHSPEQILPG